MVSTFREGPAKFRRGLAGAGAGAAPAVVAAAAAAAELADTVRLPNVPTLAESAAASAAASAASAAADTRRLSLVSTFAQCRALTQMSLVSLAQRRAWAQHTRVGCRSDGHLRTRSGEAGRDSDACAWRRDGHWRTSSGEGDRDSAAWCDPCATFQKCVWTFRTSFHIYYMGPCGTR